MNLKRAGCQIELLNSGDALALSVPDIRLIYLLDGGGSLRTGGSSFQAEKWDLVAVNSMEPVELTLEPNAVAAVLSIDYLALCDAMDVSGLRFYLNSMTDTGQKYTRIRQQMQKLLLAHLGHDYAGAFRELGCYHELLYQLLSAFLDKNPSGRVDGEDLRVASMLRYIRTNYASTLSLNEIAEQLYLSPSTASRLFQKATGEKFASYIKRFRLERVQFELLHSDTPITRIAMDNGISTPSALNKIFRQEYGLTPTEYREQRARETREDESAHSARREKVYQILQEQQKMQENDLLTHLVMAVDVSRLQPWKR